nr:hypothetical protein BCU03_09565 [Vibrio breoganii]
MPGYIKGAIKSGVVPVIRDWRNKHLLKDRDLTPAEIVCRFAERYLKIPEGEHVGKPLRLTMFQEVFIHCVFQDGVDTAILSIARRNGKTFVIAVICLALQFSSLAMRNRVLGSAAMSRDQAALLFRAMSQMIEMSPPLKSRAKITDSAKRIVNLKNGSEYYALSADAKTGHGKSLAILILDESGQIVAPNNDFVDMLITSQGSYENPLFITISTQAPADRSWLSQQIDGATASPSNNVVCHVYAADEKCDLTDEEQWLKANPLMGDGYRSKKDLVKLSQKAEKLPTQENGFRNLNLNQRITLQQLWLSPGVWKENSGPVNMQVFRDNPVSLGLDLSQKNDLTAAVISATDDQGITHVKCYAFTPMEGLEDRAREDRNPYDVWVRDGHMVAVPGRTIDYDWVCQYLKREFDGRGFEVGSVEFDRWRINELKGSAERTGFAQMAEWHEVGQGFKDMSPRIEAMETALLQNKVRHGDCPLLLLGASNAVSVQDPAGSKKLDKTKAANKIDTIVAMVQSIYPKITTATETYEGDLSWLVG